jgi:glycosyltransferase involved in cell wall biosynthesis
MNNEAPRASIFRRYYTEEPFIDRFAASPADAVDVLIPVVHANELWESNLRSLYREIPINRLLISDGGCKDDSLDIARRFPRVTVLDHRNYVSLGYCLRKLIEAVETDWFIYVHSDVYLPDGWFDAMKRHQGSYEWFGCPQRITALIEYPNVDKLFGETRPYAGSQMGRKSAFLQGLAGIDDDFVYRQEDYVLAGIIEKAGFRHGRIEDTFHYHQVMHKPSPWARKLKRVAVQVEWSRDEEVRASTMQLYGIIKYLEPSRNLAREAEAHLLRLLELGELDHAQFRKWVAKTNPRWLPHYYRPWVAFAYKAIRMLHLHDLARRIRPLM